MVSSAAVQTPRLIGAIAFLSLLRARTTKTPMMVAMIPMPAITIGKTTVRAASAPCTDRVERGDPQDDRGDDRDHVGLEEVGGHAGAVADVVAHVVGDRRRVAGVVLGDARLDLADEIGAHVGCLGEDAAADSHEQREERGAEAEADQHRGRGVLEDEDDHRGAEQSEARRRRAR